MVRMTPREEVIGSGNLAARRTIAGVLGTLDARRISRRDAISILQESGLPARAYDETDFPISIAQQLRLHLAILKHAGPRAGSITETFSDLSRFDIARFGLLGLAMQSAPSLAEAVMVGVRHPELVWGHTRVSLVRRGDLLCFEFAMTRPDLPGESEADIDRLVAFCTLQDVVAVICLIADIMGGGQWPDRIDLAFPRPEDWDPSISPPAASVRFGAAVSSLRYPAALAETEPVKANRVSYAAYRRTAQRIAEPLTDNVSVAEQTARWLWASTPPLKRGEIAEQLGMSERSLSRRLEAERTNYNRLLAEVQAERAKNLLRDPTATAASVAYRLGYADPAAFSRAFAGWTGAAPGAWRKSALRQKPTETESEA